MGWHAWSAVGLVFSAFIFVVVGTRGGKPVEPLLQYNLLAQSLLSLLFVVPLGVAYSLRRRRSLRSALALTLLAELLFFFMAPVIPMVETSTFEGLQGGDCCIHVTSGSVSYVYSCVGATIQLWTTVTGEGANLRGYSTSAGCSYG